MAAAAPLRHHQRVFIPVLLALVSLSWAALWAWAGSPYARYLAHGEWATDGPLAALCLSLPGGPSWMPAALSGLAWLLMSTAMMLPTTLPLFDAFDRLATGRADHARLLALLAAGYVAAWGVFGLVAHAAHAMLLEGAGHWRWLAGHAWVVGAATVAAAGGFQFSRLKYLCLEQCRTPRSFVIQHWRGRHQAWHTFVLGAHHGLFCIGCCWALMLLMFVVGMGNLGWMLVLAAVMAVEKNLPWGRRLSTPLGMALLAWAAALVAQHL